VIFCYNRKVLLKISKNEVTDLRVVAGEFGGRPLKTLEGKTTRPTTDKVKGAIFNMIGPFFDGGRVLDLFSGSGSLAIEAISRGMSFAVLVEKDRRAQAVIQENIKMTKSEKQFQLLKMDAVRALTQLTGKFDLVLLDPPYAKEQIVANITQLEEQGLLAEEVMLVCETDKAVDLPEEISNFGIWKQKTYGISKVTMFTGSFDPITNGHMDIIARASKLFDELYIGLFYNKNKQGFWDVETRKRILEEVVADLPNVKIITAHDSLAVDVARDLGVTYLVRGLRNATDFDYEANMDYFNKGLAPELETVYLIASHEVTPVSSSRVRELIYFEGDISSYVPQAVVKEVEAKRGKQERI